MPLLRSYKRVIPMEGKVNNKKKAPEEQHVYSKKNKTNKELRRSEINEIIR
jgi:hypothetical protein